MLYDFLYLADVKTVVIFNWFAANKKLGQKSLEVKNILLGFTILKALNDEKINLQELKGNYLIVSYTDFATFFKVFLF